MPNTFRVIIAGSRDLRDYNLFESKCDYYLRTKVERGYKILVISGGQVSSYKRNPDIKWGADYFAEQYAAKRGYDTRIFPADWGTYGKPGGPIRNEEMGIFCKYGITKEELALNYSGIQAQYGAILFPHRYSTGTHNMIEICDTLGIPKKVIYWEKPASLQSYRPKHNRIIRPEYDGDVGE